MTYKLYVNGKFFDSEKPGAYAGSVASRRFGRLDCRVGMRLDKSDRVFFESLEDAVLSNFRPCTHCRPIDENDLGQLQETAPQYACVEEFYDRDFRKKH